MSRPNFFFPFFAVTLAACGTTASVDQAANEYTTRVGTAQSHVDIDDIVMGDVHVCALLKDGTVRCWGGATSETLIDPCNTSVRKTDAAGVGRWSSTDRSIRGLEGVVSLSAAASHTCAVIRDGTARCWGGDESDLSTGSNSPVRPIAGLADVAEISTQFFRTCARLGSGEVRCWGGRVAPNSDNFVPGWFSVASISLASLDTGAEDAPNLRQIATVCAAGEDGTVSCQRIVPTCDESDKFADRQNFTFSELSGASPMAVSFVESVVPDSAGRTFQVTESAFVSGVVDGQLRGQNHDIVRTFSSPPSTTSGIGDVAGRAVNAPTGRVAMKRAVVCFVDGGKPRCTARSGSDFLTPVPVDGVEDAVTVAMGAFQACALRADSSIVCWRFDDTGRPRDITEPFYLPPEGP